MVVRINFADVIYVERAAGYRHFGVFVGNNNVIHYVKAANDPLDGVIKETTIQKFMGDDKNLHVCYFNDKGKRISEFHYDNFNMPPKKDALSKQNPNPTPNTFSWWKMAYEIYSFAKSDDVKLYSPLETVARARSKLGERGYNLLLDNCEHFAVWCKTGLYRSEQVEKFIDTVLKS